MSDEVIFTKGMIFKKPSDKAPDFIKGNLSIKPVEFIQWMRDNIKKDSEWINISLKESRNGKYYAALDTFEPNHSQGTGNDSDVPF